MSELIAEARVLVAPDTTKFRTELVAQLATATKGVLVPVQVVPTVNTAGVTAAATSAVTAAQKASAATASQVAGAQAALATASGNAARAMRLEARAAEQLTLAETGVVNATSSVSAAQITATRSAAALATARRAEAAITRELSASQAQAVVNTLALAEAQNTQASAALRQAKANATNAASLAQASRGAASAGLSFLGLRGATLAAGGAFLTGAAGIVAFAKALQSAAQLETSLNTFRVTAEATADQMTRVQETARALGADLTLPGVTANTAADALAELSRAGLSVEDSLGGVRGVLQLSTAAEIGTADATLLVANALNAFSLAGTDASKVADLLAASAKESQGSILDMGIALQQSSAAAAEAGVSVQDTVALLTALARAGIRGSDAGTSLRTALIRLINPTDQAKDALEGLGVAIRDQAGNVRPEVFAEISDQLGRLGTAQRQATLALIFGQDAFRAAAIFGREGAQGLNELREATQEVGVAQELASARTQGLAGSVENLANQFQTLGTSIGQAVSGPAQDFIDLFAGGISNINTFVGFLGKIGEEAPRATLSFEELGDVILRIRQQGGGPSELEDELERLQTNAGLAAREFVNLVEEAGKVNRAVQIRGSDAGEELLEEQRRLNEQLKETQAEGLKAREVIDNYSQGLRDAASAAEGLRNRLDESLDRAATPLPTPQITQQGPVPIGPTARLDTEAQIAAANDDLRALERLQEIQLANAKKALANSRGNVKQRTALLQAAASAEAALITTRRQIAQRQQTAAEQSARDVETARRAADAAFLSSQENARQSQQNRLAAAQQTAGAQDDIRANRALLGLLERQIASIRESGLQQSQKRAAILQLTSLTIQTTGTLNQLIQAQKQQQAAERQAAADRVAQNLSLRTQIAEARGNDDAILVALNNEIANQRKRVAAAKKARKGVLEEQLALEQLLRQRRELLDKVSEEADTSGVGGTSLDELFKQARDIVSGAGNVGFTAASLGGLSATPRIQMEVQQRLDIVNDPAARRAAQQQASTDRLIQAIDQLTLAITGNTTTGTPVTRREQNQWRSLTQESRFFYQKQAKFMVENGLVG